MNEGIALITGATGYVGSRLASRLVEDGWSVHIVVRESSGLDLLAPVVDRLSLHEHDGSMACMMKIMQSVKPCVVFHLASLALSEHKLEQVESLINSNIMFGTQLVEAMVRVGVNRLVNTGTSWQHYNGSPYNPVCLYAATKQAFEDILRYYIEVTPLSVITLKLFDNYGPNDPRTKITELLRSAANTGSTLDMSPGEQLMDIVHVDDVIESFCLASIRMANGIGAKYETFAVSSGQPITLKEFVHIYESVIKKKIPINWGGRPYRARELMIPWNGGIAVPGWRPRVTLKNGLKSIE